MRPDRLFVAAASLALATSAWAQATPAPATASPANSAGVIPTVPPVQEPTATPNQGTNEGFFRPAPDAVVVPPFTPATPGVTPIDTPTNATVGSSSADRELRDAIASAIAADARLQGARINVLVSDGVVTLSGTALDQAQADRARALTERLAGSAQVTANITTAG